MEESECNQTKVQQDSAPVETQQKNLKEYQKEIDDLEKDLENCKNPENVQVGTNVDEEERAKFYKGMHKLSPQKIFQIFSGCGDLSNRHDFGEVNDEWIKHRINKLEKIKHYYQKKIDSCHSNENDNEKKK
jgi:oligoendopeptidase F